MLRSLKLMAAAGAMVLGVSAAHADPITLYVSFDGTTYTQLMSTTTGFATYNNVVTNGSFAYNVQFNAAGSGTSPFAAAEPSFDTQSITVSASTGGVIYLAAIETGLTNTSISGFNVGYTNNASSVSVGERFLVGQTLTPSTMSASSFLLAPLTTQSAFVSAAGLTSGYSVGERYRIDFGTTTGSVNATISERGVVPEPMSLALLGSGLVGFGIIRRRAGKSA